MQLLQLSNNEIQNDVSETDVTFCQNNPQLKFKWLKINSVEVIII